MSHYLDIAKAVPCQPAIAKPARESTEADERESIRQAFMRLELGKTKIIRLYSGTAGGELIITRDKLLEMITVNIPHFTLDELAKLATAQADKATIRKIYQIKETFPGSKIDDIERTKQ